MRTSKGGRIGAWVVVLAVAGCASGSGRLAGAPKSGWTAAGRDDVRPEDSVQVGYGSQDRRRVTGSVASVSGDESRTRHMIRVEELLQRVPGVRVTPRSDGSYSVTIRGSSTLSSYGQTDPLFVIDGMPVDGGASILNSIPPQDVERIDVLKDAEASIYGSRAANGVILVRTRRARSVVHD